MAFNPVNPNGQATSANSAPVVVASDQSAIPITDNSGSLTVDAPVGTPVFVRLSDGSSAIATLPISAASLPLPSGASTAAKQPALGTAGSASADVITVQGIASMTPIANNLTQIGGSTQSATNPLFVRLTNGTTALAYGQTTMSASLPVAIASDQSALSTSAATRTLTTATGTFSSSGDNTAISAPGVGVKIVITALRIQLEASTATTVLIKDGASTTKARVLCQQQGDGIDRVYESGRELRLTNNTALVLNLSGANSVGYSVEYFTE